jgi:hypothetical protein
MNCGCSLGSIVEQPHAWDAQAMCHEISNELDAVPSVLVETAPIADRAIDETSEDSFPASDPPSSWTWDVAGRPPGSPTR